MKVIRLLVLSFVLLAAACSKCNEEQAYNKMLAFNKIQGRLAAAPGDGGEVVALALGKEAAEISELIGKKDYDAACEKADAMAKRMDIDLEKEQKDMITYEQLKADGGKGAGNCSVADAAKMQMEVHGMLQKQVDEGKKDSSIFNLFAEDTKGYGEMLSTNPSAACKLFEDLKVKYGLK